MIAVSERLVTVGIGTAWLSLVGLCFVLLYYYEGIPGAALAPSGAWPEKTRVAYEPGRPHLVMAIHPRCPCTRATLRELERIIARTDGKLEVRLLFWVPPGALAGWEETDLWKMARALPNVKTLRDPAGTEAKMFGARTSGHTVLYDLHGRAVFTGGITPARGHEGVTRGGAAIITHILTGQTLYERTQVFGCSFGPPVLGGVQ